VGEDRGAEGAEGGEVWGGCHRPTENGAGRGLCPLSRKKMILSLNMVSIGAFWVVFFYSSAMPVLHAKPV